jgi:hypothetical protein
LTDLGRSPRPAFAAALALLICFLPSTSSAQWEVGGDAPEDASWRKTAGTFGAMLLVTPDAERFFATVRNALERGEEPEVETTVRVRRGRSVSAVIVISRCAVDPDGNCDTTVDYRVVAPDGSEYARFSAAEVWTGKPGPPAGVLQPGVTNLDLEIEPDDALGEYRVEAVVWDRVSGVRLALWSPLKVLPAE